MTRQEKNGVEFFFDLKVKSQLEVEYVVINKSSESVLLFNRHYHQVDDLGVPLFDPNLCIVVCDGETILVSKILPLRPAGKFFEHEYIPALTLVAPGDHFKEAISLKLPLKAWSPYRRRTENLSLRTLMCSVQIGYFSIPSDCVSSIYHPELGIYWPASFDYSNQITVSSGSGSPLVPAVC